MTTTLRLLILLSAVCLLEACGSDPAATTGTDAAHGESATAEPEPEKGPHGGRLLRSGDFALEVKIFEEGVPPEYHLYGFVDGKPLPPQQFEAQVVLRRLGGRVDRFSFVPVGDFRRGNGVVVEPHSFDVEVTANHAGRTHEWKFDSYEGRTDIAPEIAEASGLETEVAGPAAIREEVELTGAIQARTDGTGRVTARFPGVVRELRANVGDRIARGAVLAIVQSNESLENYAVTAPVAGTVLERDAQVGQLTSGTPIFVIADLEEVWAELEVFGADLQRVATGQRVSVEAVDGSVKGEGRIVRIAPFASQSSQTVRARVSLQNAAATWRPGQFVRGRVVVAEAPVPLAVRNVGLQQFRDFQVVFAKVGDTYEVRMLELGRSDRERTEVLGGLTAGERYVTENSFLVKADVEKYGASHDH